MHERLCLKAGRGVAKLCQAPRRPATHLELNPQLCAKPAEAQNLRRLGSEDELHEPAEEYSSATFASLPEEAAVLTEPIPDPKEYSPTHVTVLLPMLPMLPKEYSPAMQQPTASTSDHRSVAAPNAAKTDAGGGGGGAGPEPELAAADCVTSGGDSVTVGAAASLRNKLAEPGVGAGVPGGGGGAAPAAAAAKAPGNGPGVLPSTAGGATLALAAVCWRPPSQAVSS